MNGDPNAKSIRVEMREMVVVVVVVVVLATPNAVS
jgi:hypothetical protein